VSFPSCEHAWSLQQGGEVDPHAVPVVPQLHQRASVQNPPLVPPVYILQQPVAQSVFLAQDRRQPTQSETSVGPLQRPVQQSAPLVQLAPTFPQDEVQREAVEQTAWPVFSSSKQHPEGQSVFAVHGR
jgi:hypothetical protein